MRMGGELPLEALPKSGTGPLSRLFATSIHCRRGSTGEASTAAEEFFHAAHLHHGQHTETLSRSPDCHSCLFTAGWWVQEPPKPQASV